MFEAFQIGPFLLWSHLLFLLLAVWLSTEFFLRLAHSSNFSLQQFKDQWWQYLLGMALCGRILAIVSEYRTYWNDPLRVFMVHDGNFSFLGLAIGVGVVLSIQTRGSRVTFLQWLDVLVPAASFGMCLDWLGKFAAGQSYGKPTDLFWGVIYDVSSVRYTVPIHPVQLYYAFFFFLITFVLLVVRKHAKWAGAETLVGIVVGSVATMFFETFRGDIGITVTANTLDFILMLCLFLSLGIFAAIEIALSQRVMVIYELALTLIIGVYFFIRPTLHFATYQLRFSQFLAVLALLGVVVYVIVQRRRHPHLP